jgi:hypothetical protein
VHCKDRNVRVVSIPEGTERRVFSPDQHANSFLYSQDGGWPAVGFNDGSVEVLSSQGTAPSKRWQASERRIDFPARDAAGAGTDWVRFTAPTQPASLRSKLVVSR